MSAKDRYVVLDHESGETFETTKIGYESLVAYDDWGRYQLVQTVRSESCLQPESEICVEVEESACLCL
ncbi:hypothetical protein [Mangrovibacterium sp.]|uniref:hypothetical protein n=1 Tax=Mangrovibacterium sp. TaxID=1961364 RepID=UPI00356375C4